MARNEKPEYALRLLGEALIKEEKNLQFWQAIIDKSESDPPSLRQAKGNLPSTQKRIEELKKVIEILDPPAKPE